MRQQQEDSLMEKERGLDGIGIIWSGCLPYSSSRFAVVWCPRTYAKFSHFFLYMMCLFLHRQSPFAFVNLGILPEAILTVKGN